MASSYTSRIRLEQQGDGENPNSWGAILNQNVISLVDDAIGAYTTIGTSGSQLVNDTTLTTNDGAADQARSAMLELQGYVVSASAANIVLPAQSKFYFVHNKVVQSSATGTLRIINAGATATGLTVNTSVSGTPAGNFVAFSDGVNVYGINTRGLSFGGAALKDVLTSIGEIETTTVDPVTSVTSTDNTRFISNGSTVNPFLLGLSSTDARYVNVSSGYTNKIGSYNEFNSRIKVSAGHAFSPLVTVAVSDTSIFAINLEIGNNFVFQVSADSTLRQPDNINVGQQGIIYAIQDATSGGKTLSFANDFKFNNGTIPTFTTSISAVDLLAYSVRSVAVSASTTTAVIDIAAIQNMKR